MRLFDDEVTRRRNGKVDDVCSLNTVVRLRDIVETIERNRELTQREKPLKPGKLSWQSYMADERVPKCGNFETAAETLIHWLTGF